MTDKVALRIDGKEWILILLNLAMFGSLTYDRVFKQQPKEAAAIDHRTTKVEDSVRDLQIKVAVVDTKVDNVRAQNREVLLLLQELTRKNGR